MSRTGQEDGRNNQPAGDSSWGENSKQAHPDFPLSSDDDRPSGWHNKHTDADEIRRKFGVAEMDFREYADYETPYPNMLVHTVEGEYFGHPGGTNLLAVGEKGSGKSTLGLHISQREMDNKATIPGWANPDGDQPAEVELPPDAVVWRGQPSASEWLPFKPWTTLWLPEPQNASAEATWKSEDVRKTASRTADLHNVVRNVRYYSDPRDINEGLKPGTFNVVYPDPSFSGCAEIMRDSDYCPEPVPFTPAWEADDPEEVTPLVHWWFAYLVSKLEYGPYGWTSVVFDEAADFAPQSARADKNQTYTKVRALRKVMAHSRKHYLSLYFFGHHEENLHSKVRRTIQWRIDMPDGTANRNSNQHNPPVGFSQIPMYADMLSNHGPGKAITWTETNFTRFTWEDYADWTEDSDVWLSLTLGEPTAAGPVTPTSRGSNGGGRR